MTLKEIIKQNEEEFDKIPTEMGVGCSGNHKAFEQFLNQSQLRLISAFKEMVEGVNNFRNAKIDIGGKECCTKTFNNAMEQCACKLDALLSSLTEDTK
jgi:hypothetical protein